MILKDKLPEELNREEFFVVKLSQGDKFFRLEIKKQNVLYREAACLIQ